MPTKMHAKGMTPTAEVTPRKAVKLAPEGLVTAIVAVTGVVDAVNDLIVPGAFAATLRKRRPKVVDDHEWQHKVGRVLHVEEWMPGDERLPKLTKDGKPWPKEAGALVATMQYNLNTERGAESFEFVRFYAESNEAEFSIGYKVPDGKARLRRDGVRVILMVDLFEFSHVLFGAAPLSMALEVKGMNGLTGGTVTQPALTGGNADEDEDLTQRPTRGKTITDGDPGDDEPEQHYDDPPKFDPNRQWDEETEEDYLAERAADALAPYEAKTAAGVLIAASLERIEKKVSAAWEANEGDAERLRRYWTDGEGGKKIAWGTPGDFDRCVAELTDDGHMTPEQAKGYCNLRHHDALGYYPATHAKMEGKAALPTAAPMEGKSMNTMKGSYEQRIEAISAAAEDLFEKMVDDLSWVCPVATYDREVIVNVYADGEPPKSYLLPYTIAGGDGDADDVELGEPQAVELTLVAQPEDGGPAKEAADADAETLSVAPLLDALATAGTVAKVEGKAGDLVRGRLAALMAGVQGKSALDRPDGDPEDQLDGGADESTEDGTTDPEDQLDGGADEAAEGEPPVKQKAAPSPDPEDAADGGADEGDEYDDTPEDPEDAADGGVDEATEDQQQAKGSPADPDDDGDASGDADSDGDGGKVTLSPDEHFANMDALADGPDSEPDDDEKPMF